MQPMHTFARDEVFPSWFPNALGNFLGVAALQFALTRQDATHVQVIAGANDQAAVISIGGLWRYNEATVTRAVAGAAGTYDVFVTAKANNIVSAPALYTDATDYGFALAVVPSGMTPVIVAGTVDVFRKVGSLTWDGAQVTSLTPSVGRSTPLPHAASHAHGGSDALLAGSVTGTELASGLVLPAGVTAPDPPAGDTSQKVATTNYLRLRASFLGGGMVYASDWNGSLGYAVDALGMVHIQGAVSQVTGPWTDAMIVGTLPAGFRPTGSVNFICYMADAGGRKAVDVNIAGSGVITLYQLPGMAPSGRASGPELNAITYRQGG